METLFNVFDKSGLVDEGYYLDVTEALIANLPDDGSVRHEDFSRTAYESEADYTVLDMESGAQTYFRRN